MKAVKVLVVASALAATSAFAAPFNAEQLAVAAKSAAVEFRAEVGQAAYDAVYGLQATQAASGGKVKVFYKDAQNVAKTLELACHFHEADEIDCHAL